MNETADPAADGVVLGDVRFSRAEIEQRVSGIAGGMASRGVQRGDRVAILMHNDIPFLEASMAASRLGAPSVLVNWHSTEGVVRHVMATSAPRLLIAHRSLLDKFRAAIPDDVETVIAPISDAVAHAHEATASAQPATSETRTWNEWVTSGGSGISPSRPSGNDIVSDTISYTSGTTGLPKGVRRVFGEVSGAVAAQARLIGLGPGLRHVVTGPLYHAAPSTVALRTLRQGGLVVVQPRFEPAGLLQLVERHEINYLNVVPTMFVRLLALPDKVRGSYDLSSLTRVIHGAGPCPIALKRKMIEWLGPVVYEYYGGTEAGMATFCDSAEALSHPGTVGRAMPGVTIRIVDDDGKQVPAGEIGEIYIKNEAMPDFEYLGDQASRSEVERDGLVTQGDMGYVDGDGYLFLAGRKREMIVSGGVNIYCAEIEEHLSTMDGVRSSAAFAVPDPELGEAVGVAVELDGTRELRGSDVAEYVRAGLGRLKAPKVVDFSSELSRSDVGKVFKKQLAAKYWQE